MILTDKSIGRVLKAAAKALKKIHDAGESHGRVNPEHLFINSDGKVTLLSPAAVQARELQDQDSSLEVTDSKGYQWELLVHEFVPPEARNGEPYVGSPAGDMWQLGVSLSCMLYGRIESSSGNIVSSETSQNYVNSQDYKKKKSLSKVRKQKNATVVKNS